MKVCVVGLWHLGTVTAACLADAGHEVIGLDFDAEVVARLKEGHPPIFEPGLEDLVSRGLREGRLRFTADVREAVANAEVAWIAFDTPVDDEDRADVEHVLDRVRRLLPHLADGALVLLSSQVPVGTTAALERACPNRSVRFGYSPENLRLGKAIAVFTQPDRVIVGVRDEEARSRVRDLLAPITDRVEWMSVESAEMVKHALNAFLAVSVTFANEIATLCEAVGADAKEVERGLKTESRIGPRAYLAPGAAFAGGTLARDVVFLTGLGAQHEVATQLLSAVRASNETHRRWVQHRLLRDVGDLRGRTVAVLGLTYKPGTDTLRRSAAVELCRWLSEQGARVRAHDPAVRSLPADLGALVTLCATPAEALAGASAAVVATEWPEFATLAAADVAAAMADPLVIDPNRFLVAALDRPPIRYRAVGTPAPTPAGREL